MTDITNTDIFNILITRKKDYIKELGLSFREYLGFYHNVKSQRNSILLQCLRTVNSSLSFPLLLCDTIELTAFHREIMLNRLFRYPEFPDIVSFLTAYLSN